MFKIIASISFAFAVTSVCLANGLEAAFEIKNLEKNTPPLTQKFLISGDKITMQTRTGENNGTAIFRGDKELLWVIDNQNKQYTEMTKETMAQMGKTLNSVMDQMKTQMAGMSPEQRAMMENLMKGQMSQMQGATEKTIPLSFKKTGIKKTINGYPCEKYDVFRGTEKLREMWVTEWKNMNDFKEAMTAFDSMGKFFATMMESLKGSPFLNTMDIPYSHTAELNGFPVMSTELKDGIPVMEATLKEVTKKPIPESDFNPPAGYKINTSLMNLSNPAKPEIKKQ